MLDARIGATTSSCLPLFKRRFFDAMSEFPTNKAVDADARRLALQAIATLAHIKRIAADQVLRPAGVPEDLIHNFIAGKDAATGAPLTKRQSGAMILDRLAQDGRDRTVVRKLIELSAKWDSFHLADDEYKARAVVQKAREMVGALVEAE